MFTVYRLNDWKHSHCVEIVSYKKESILRTGEYVQQFSVGSVQFTQLNVHSSVRVSHLKASALEYLLLQLYSNIRNHHHSLNLTHTHLITHSESVP